MPCRPVTGPAAVGLCDGDRLVETGGDAGGDDDAGGEGEGEAVDVTLGETATATGGRKVDSRQAASASRPSNAGPATPSYRIPRR